MKKSFDKILFLIISLLIIFNSLLFPITANFILSLKKSDKQNESVYQNVDEPINWCAHMRVSDIGENRTRMEIALQKAKELGLKYVRIDFEWKLLEPNIDEWDEKYFQWYEDFLNISESKGIKVIATLAAKLSAPGWAIWIKDFKKEKFWDELGEYVEKVAERFGDRIDYYQLSNEENVPQYSFFNDEEEPKAFEVMWKSLKKKDKNFSTIINIAIWGVWTDYIDNVLTKAGKYIDIIGIDPYPGTIWSIGDFDYVMEEISRVNDKDSLWYGKRVAISETGCCGLGQKNHEEWIRKYIPNLKIHVNEFNKKGKSRIEFVCYYSLFTGFLNYGLIDRETYQPKEAYYVLQSYIKR